MSESRVALITGCGKRNGMGAAIARRLAAAGTRVVVSDVAPRGVANKLGDTATPANEDAWGGLPSLVDEIASLGGQALAIEADITSEVDVQQLVDRTLEQLGRLDILVNNAAAPISGDDNVDVEHVPLDAWQSILGINLTGTFLMSRAAIPPMRRQGWGRVVSISSVAAQRGFPRTLAYSASKAGILGLTRALAVELAPVGITVNAICPGLTLTTRAVSGARRQGAEDVAEKLRQRASTMPLGRHGDPSEIAEVVAFLVSEAASFVSGQAITADGGWTMATR